MESTSSGGAAPDPITTWLKRLVLLALAVFLGFCSWFVWRISRVAAQSETAIAEISADVKQMSSSGAQISQHLVQLDDRLRRIEEKAAGAIKSDEFEHLLDEVGELRNTDTATPRVESADTEREIKHLLTQIRRSDYRFKYSDENKGGMSLYVQLYAKYKAYDKLLSSTEDFIDKVCTTTITGHPYEVVVDETQTVTLKDWLTQELAKYRADGAKSPSGAAKAQ